MKRKLLLIVVLLFMLTIFLFSNMNSNNSNSKSKDILNNIITNYYKIEYKLGLIDNIPSDKEILIKVNKYNLPFRKMIHASEYLILFLLILFTIGFNKRNILIGLIICFIYACTDEIHQLFVLDRTGSFIDVLIDMIGPTIGTIGYLIISKIKSR